MYTLARENYGIVLEQIKNARHRASRAYSPQGRSQEAKFSCSLPAWRIAADWVPGGGIGGGRGSG